MFELPNMEIPPAASRAGSPFLVPRTRTSVLDAGRMKRKNERKARAGGAHIFARGSGVGARRLLLRRWQSGVNLTLMVSVRLDGNFPIGVIEGVPRTSHPFI